MPGRKTDVLDCQWLQQLHTYGLLSGAFRPEGEIRRLRSYLRQRAMLVEYASHHVQHMQKALTQMKRSSSGEVRPQAYQRKRAPLRCLDALESDDGVDLTRIDGVDAYTA